MKNLILHSLAETKNFAQEIAKNLKKGDVLCLKGNLGVGKTVIAREIINFLSKKDCNVTSPTFTLLNTYTTDKGEIWHYDLYRLENEEEVYELGIEDAFQYGITIIEWPDIIADILPIHTKIVELDYGNKDNERIVLS